MGEAMANRHRFHIRVYFEDTDAGGIVYYANYLRYAERARTEFLRGLGLESSQLMRDEGVILAVRRCSVDFQGTAILDDNLAVETMLKRVGGASLEVLQSVYRSDCKLVDMNLKLGCMSLEGRASRLPLSMREALNNYLNSKKF